MEDSLVEALDGDWTHAATHSRSQKQDKVVLARASDGAREHRPASRRYLEAFASLRGDPVLPEL